MESFKLVIDGIDLTKEDRKRIEKGIERAMVEALAGKAKGMVFRPVSHSKRPARADGAAEGLESDEFGRITKLLPNGGILLQLLDQERAAQIAKTEFPGSKLGEAVNASQFLHTQGPGSVAQPGQQLGGSARNA